MELKNTGIPALIEGAGGEIFGCFSEGGPYISSTGGSASRTTCMSKHFCTLNDRIKPYQRDKHARLTYRSIKSTSTPSFQTYICAPPMEWPIPIIGCGISNVEI